MRRRLLFSGKIVIIKEWYKLKRRNLCWLRITDSNQKWTIKWLRGGKRWMPCEKQELIHSVTGLTARTLQQRYVKNLAKTTRKRYSKKSRKWRLLDAWCPNAVKVKSGSLTSVIAAVKCRSMFVKTWLAMKTTWSLRRQIWAIFWVLAAKSWKPTRVSWLSKPITWRI